MACTMYAAADNVMPSLNPKLNTHWPVKAIRNTTNKFKGKEKPKGQKKQRWNISRHA